MSQPPPIPVPAAATVVIFLNIAAFAVAVPVVAIVLLALALKNGCARHPPSSYAFLASLTVISVLAGAFSSHIRAEAIAQALLSFFLGIPVLYFTPAVYTGSRCQFIVRIILTGLLLLSLSSATFLALLSPFFSIPTHLPNDFFIAYTILAILRLIPHFFNLSKPVSFSRPITIHVATHRTTAIPINLSSVNHSFLPSSCVSYHQRDQKSNSILPGDHHQKRTSTDSSISTVSAVKLVHIPSSSLPDIERQPSQSTLHPQPIHERTLLTRLLLAQLFCFIGYICALGATYTPVYKPALGLVITRAVCTALGVMITISASFFGKLYSRPSLALASGADIFLVGASDVWKRKANS